MKGFIKKLNLKWDRLISVLEAKPQIKIFCSVSEYCDKKDAGGLWDLSAKIAFNVAISKGALPAKIDVEEWGQETIYKILREYTEE